MFTLEEIKAELNRLSEMVGDTFDIPVMINGRLTRTLGRVVMTINRGTGYCKNERMEFSKQMLETSTRESIISVIQHEWCHYMVTKETHQDHGHDRIFKAMCARIGCDNDKTTTKVERTVAANKLYKYTIWCDTCKQDIGGYSRMNKTLQNIQLCTCKKCGTNKLSYTQNW